MNQRQRTKIMDKARAKRRRRHEGTAAASEPINSATPTSIEKVVDLAEGAAVQVGAFVRSAARTLTNAVSSKPSPRAPRKQRASRAVAESP